jgi:hypothetical protein
LHPPVIPAKAGIHESRITYPQLLQQQLMQAGMRDDKKGTENIKRF